MDTTTAPASIAPWSACSTVIEALAARDFPALGRGFAPTARFRALLPPCTVDVTGRDAITGLFSEWFGNTESVELVDVVVAQIGSRLHLSWRLHVHESPHAPGWSVIEQHLFVDGHDTIEQADLLCSGFVEMQP
ncbi:MAG TPA: nuclear transport factor 2 family protein [Euzebya sp.]|nr:nuclear transport factor 2 family protein [Euzebya sp.]